jgi:Mrp family chromosome partitioning ATPase
MGIDSALESEKRKDALVQDQLYVVKETETNQNLTSNLPKRFKSLVPRLKASDYDYIIFDMPPVSQISLTPRLSKFMDTVLLVVESEKTDRDVVRKATSLLAESKTNVGVVLNKGRNYGPKNLTVDV